MIFDTEKVLKVMIESGYFEEIAIALTKAYEKKEVIIQEALNQWVNDKTVKNIEVEGIDLEYIINKKGCNIFAALTTMNVFLKNPELAKEFK